MLITETLPIIPRECCSKDASVFADGRDALKRARDEGTTVLDGAVLSERAFEAPPVVCRRL